MPDAFDDATLELVNAYLDGEMDAMTQATFEERLEREPALRSLVEGMRSATAEVAAAFGQPPVQPPSEGLMAAVRAFAAAQTAEPVPGLAETGTVVPFQTRQKAGSAPQVKRDPWPLPIAATIAFFVGGGGMWLAQSFLTARDPVAAVAIRDGVVTQSSPLHAALERALSGPPITAGTETIRPILSFAAKDGRFCREFEAFGESGSVVGVACKGERGWRMEVLLSAAPQTRDGGQYAPASGFNAKALDDVVSQLMVGGPLNAPAEMSARDKGWRSTP
jgi:hypothetical protein